MKILIFSIKNAFRKKTIAILSSLGVGFGLMLVFVLSSFSAGVRTQFDQNFAEVLGQVQITEKLEQGADSNLPVDLPYKLLSTANVGEYILNYNVETELPRFFTADYIGEMENDEDTLVLKGLNKTLDSSWEGPTSKILEGRVFNNRGYEIILDSRLLETAQFPVEIGDTIKVNLDVGGTKTEKLTIVGIYDQSDSGAPDFVPRRYFIYTDVFTAWDLLDSAGEKSDIITQILLDFDVETNNETQLYVDRMNNISEDGGYDPTYISAISLGGNQEAFEETFDILDSFTAIIGFITTLAGGMAIIVTQLMSVTSRMKEFAILKATGWKNIHIFKNVIYESLTLGGLGALFGLGLGSLIIFALGSGASPFGSATAVISIESVFIVIAYALGLGVLGGIYPAIKASRVRPITVLKGE